MGDDFKIVVIYLWLHWVFAAAYRLSLVVGNGGSSLVALHRFLLVLASLVVDYRLSSCGSQALKHGFSISSPWA